MLRIRHRWGYIQGDYVRDDVNDIRLCYSGRFYRAADKPICVHVGIAAYRCCIRVQTEQINHSISVSSSFCYVKGMKYFGPSGLHTKICVILFINLLKLQSCTYIDRCPSQSAPIFYYLAIFSDILFYFSFLT